MDRFRTDGKLHGKRAPLTGLTPDRNLTPVAVDDGLDNAQANANGTLTSTTEFDLNLIVEKTGTGDYCGSEYLGYTLPCTDVISALFTSALGGGGGGGAGGEGGGEGG